LGSVYQLPLDGVMDSLAGGVGCI